MARAMPSAATAAAGAPGGPHLARDDELRGCVAVDPEAVKFVEEVILAPLCLGGDASHMPVLELLCPSVVGAPSLFVREDLLRGL